MSRYPEVASTIECSAKLNFGVLDVFVSAQKVSSKHAQTGPNPNYLNPNCPKRTQNSHKANGSASPKFKPPQTQLSITRPGSVTVPRTTCSTSKVSDKQNSRVSSSYILQCAIYPICPVFNARTGKLTAQASNAIKRIFNIADHNFNDVIEKVKTMSVL